VGLHPWPDHRGRPAHRQPVPNGPGWPSLQRGGHGLDGTPSARPDRLIERGPVQHSSARAIGSRSGAGLGAAMSAPGSRAVASTGWAATFPNWHRAAGRRHKLPCLGLHEGHLSGQGVGERQAGGVRMLRGVPATGPIRGLRLERYIPPDAGDCRQTLLPSKLHSHVCGLGGSAWSSSLAVWSRLSSCGRC
jgi:hypothetical protein